jgi:hypothetical protein
MNPPFASIGLENHIVSELKSELGHIIPYDSLPSIYSIEGKTFVESLYTLDKYLKVSGVLYYCYFDNPGIQRRALALSSTPTFPDVRKTILHDDKAISLILAIDADPEPSLDRGFIIANKEIRLHTEEIKVAKSGDWHCGEGKSIYHDKINVSAPSVVEPFIKGESHRILIVGEEAWQLHYESTDWRKNVNSTISLVQLDNSLANRAKITAKNLGLVICGVDYIINDDGAFLLEVNAYPELSVVKEAERGFVDLAVEWGKKIVND